MKAVKIWAIGNLILQGILWGFMFIASTINPAAGWLVFLSIFLFFVALFQLPLMLTIYLGLKESVKTWTAGYSVFLWVGSFVLVLVLSLTFLQLNG